MVDVIPILLMAFGIVSAVAPEWVGAIHRAQKAAGTTTDPGSIDVSRTWYAVTRVTGVIVFLLGLGLTIQSL